MESLLMRSGLVVAFVALPQISAASNALNALEDVVAFIAACIGVGLCALLSLIYLLIKKRAKVFAYITIGFTALVGVFFLSVHFGFFLFSLLLCVLVFMKFKKRNSAWNANF